MLFLIKRKDMQRRILTALLVSAALFYACTPKEKEHTEETQTAADANEWPEMDAFHLIMAEAFHPYKDSANLEPAKRMAEEMATEADKWAGATLPEKVNTDDVKAQLQQLKADTRSLADKVKASAPDEEIGASLTALHDSFHSIMEAWHGGHHEGH